MREKVAKLIALRRHSMPLLYGDFIPVGTSEDFICYERVYLGEIVVVEIDRKNLDFQIIINGKNFNL